MRLASHGSEAQTASCIFWPLSMIYGGETETGLASQSSARVSAMFTGNRREKKLES